MKLLLDERNLIIAIGSNIEYGTWGNVHGTESWKITETQYMMDGGFHLEDIGEQEIPSYVRENEYYYIDGEFKFAEECPNEYKERIAELESQVALADETTIELYEAQIAQDEAIMAQDEAIIELYELYNNLQ